MGNPEERNTYSSNRRNFIAKKLREDQQFRKKVHKNAKDKAKENKWSRHSIYDGEEQEDFESCRS